MEHKDRSSSRVRWFIQVKLYIFYHSSN